MRAAGSEDADLDPGKVPPVMCDPADLPSRLRRVQFSDGPAGEGHQPDAAAELALLLGAASYGVVHYDHLFRRGEDRPRGPGAGFVPRELHAANELARGRGARRRRDGRSGRGLRSGRVVRIAASKGGNGAGKTGERRRNPQYPHQYDLHLPVDSGTGNRASNGRRSRDGRVGCPYARGPVALPIEPHGAAARCRTAPSRQRSHPVNARGNRQSTITGAGGDGGGTGSWRS